MRLKLLLPTFISIVVIALIWQYISISVGIPSIFPSLADLVGQIYQLIVGSDFLINVSITLFRGLLGFIIAFSLGISLATMAVYSQFWKAFFHPFVIITRSVPVISFVLIAMLWFSPPFLPVYIAIITMFPIIYQNTLSGFEHTDFKLIEMAKVFGKTPISCYFSIYLLSSKKYIVDGIRTAVGFGWRAIIIGEALSQPIHGIGSAMKQAQVYINVSELMAWTIVAIAVSYLSEGIIKLLSGIHYKVKPKMQNELIQYGIHKPEIKAIELINLDKYFNGNPVFKEYSLTINNEQINCVKGASGKGKTTLLRLISGLENPDKGSISNPKNYRMSYSFQDLRLLPWLTVYENIAFGVNHKVMNRKYIYSQIPFLMEKMELSEHINKFPNELSGGEQQRVGLLRALVASADVLLLDEPLSGLDENLKTKIMKVLINWITEYRPLVIWATHEKVESQPLMSRDIVL